MNAIIVHGAKDQKSAPEPSTLALRATGLIVLFYYVAEVIWEV